MPRDHSRRSRGVEDSDSERRSSKRSRRDEDIPEISSESDALRHASFEDWLYDEKGRRVKDLSRDDRGHYARKFRGRWNTGKLSSRYYKQSSASTSDRAREPPKAAPSTSVLKPNAVEELQLRREREAEERDQSHQETAYQRKKDRREARQEAKEHQSVGKEKMLEQRAALRSSNAEFAARKDETDMAFTDDFLGLDGGNSFQQALAAREKRKAKPTAKQLRCAPLCSAFIQSRDVCTDQLVGRRAEEKAAEMEEKRAVYNEKESATMDVGVFEAALKVRGSAADVLHASQMFKALAKERFG